MGEAGGIVGSTEPGAFGEQPAITRPTKHNAKKKVMLFFQVLIAEKVVMAQFSDFGAGAKGLTLKFRHPSPHALPGIGSPL